MDINLLKTLRLWDSLSELLEVVVWTKFMSLALPMYEHLFWGFLSSLRVDWSTSYQTEFDFSIEILIPT